MDYELIWKLQTDELVDRNLTPQTKASIRIVLGTVARRLGIGRTTLGRWVQAGKLPEPERSISGMLMFEAKSIGSNLRYVSALTSASMWDAIYYSETATKARSS
ncbi:MAG: hypothetical protein GXY55_16890 [Phycisphaerae bacterium]|nr:hypothetical protein [Phycisphaerae bacterium]